MSSLEKFNSTMDSLDKEVKNLKSVSESYKKLDGLVTSFDNVNGSFAENITHFQTLLESQKSHHETVTNSIASIQLAQKQHKDDLEKKLDDKIKVLSDDNAKFLTNLHNTLKLQLDNNKIEIKQLIDSERLKIKEIVQGESLNLNKNVSSLKWMLGLIGGVVILLEIAILVLRFIKP
jgi:hypothetical protein